jgi:molecular chaperone GrpE (heat shock protein)
LAARIEEKSEKDDTWKVLRFEELNAKYRKTAEELTRHRDSQDDLGVRSLMEGLFPVYDTLVEKIGNANSNSTEQETLKLLRDDFLEVLETKGVRPLIPESDEFDRAVHQVIEVVATDEADQGGKVAERIKTGFIKDGTLLLRKEWIKRYLFTSKGEETNG